MGYASAANGAVKWEASIMPSAPAAPEARGASGAIFGVPRGGLVRIGYPSLGGPGVPLARPAGPRPALRQRGREEAMAHDALPPDPPPGPVWLNPWAPVAAAVGLSLAGLALAGVEQGWADALRPAVLGLALL